MAGLLLTDFSWEKPAKENNRKASSNNLLIPGFMSLKYVMNLTNLHNSFGLTIKNAGIQNGGMQKCRNAGMQKSGVYNISGAGRLVFIPARLSNLCWLISKFE